MQFDIMTSTCKLFLEAMKYDSGSSKREIFIHETCATDTENVKRVFEDVQVIPRVYFIFILAKAKQFLKEIYNTVEDIFWKTA